jgi:hypothetical protein
LGQALHLINGDTLQGKINQGQVVANLLAAGKTPAEVLETLYLRCLGRGTTEQEKQTLMPILDEDPDKARALNDVFWALLNSREFVFCH